MGLFDFGVNALKEKLSSISNNTTTTQKKTPPRQTFWHKFLSALKAFFAKK